MARANSLPAPNVKSAAVSWLSRINPSKGCESTCSLTAYGREFKHLAPARYDGFSWSINGFGADADANHVGCRLSREYPDEIGKQELADRDLAPGIDDEPCRHRRQHRFDHHQRHHDEQRWREQIACQLQT